jgi:hypothetical protein
MSTTKALRGFLPARKRGSGANSTGFEEIPIASALAKNIFTGDTVQTTLGNCEPVTVGGTSLGDAPVVAGVFQGCHYVQDGQPKWSKYWPSGTSATNATAMVDTDPTSTYYIQADTSVSAGDINKSFFGLTVGAGSTVTGQSGFGVKAATRLATQAIDVYPVAVKNEPGNDITVALERAYPVLEVRLAHHKAMLAPSVTLA